MTTTKDDLVRFHTLARRHGLWEGYSTDDLTVSCWHCNGEWPDKAPEQHEDGCPLAPAALEAALGRLKGLKVAVAAIEKACQEALDSDVGKGDRVARADLRAAVNKIGARLVGLYQHLIVEEGL